ncbi:MAG: hypothetical protein IJP31_03150 [Lachnospiraceae bacterium]|nr:hypothetical protein [Lachnospiraceae bacterium]
MRQKRGKLITFLCSLIPGAAEMYMGFMKKGISLMAVFILSIVVPSVLRVSDVFILFAVLIWFYSFFHARNLVACKEEEFWALADEYVWASFLEGREVKVTNPTLRKWGAGILIVYGVSQLWHIAARWIYYMIPDYLWEVVSMFVDEVPQILVSVVIIIIGLKLIAGKKEELDGEGK